MTRFSDALRAWNTQDFARTLTRRIEALGAELQPLERAAPHGGRIDPGSLKAALLAASEDASALHARVGVFFTEVLAGCSCGDGPTPIDAYCELQVRIDKASGEASFSLPPDA